MLDSEAVTVKGRSLRTPLKQTLIQIADDIEDVLKAYEHLAVRVFIFLMAIYGLIRAAMR